jgi:hypothetical protein
MGDAMMFTKLSYATLVAGLFALSACGPSPTNAANPQVKGDNSTISGDKADTKMNQQGQVR